MKITIDTEKDSKEEIEKTISFLKKLVDQKTEGQSADVSGGAFDMFDSQPVDSDSEDEDDGESDDDVQVQPYTF